MQVMAQPPTVLTSVLPPEGEFWVIPEKCGSKTLMKGMSYALLPSAPPK